MPQLLVQDLMTSEVRSLRREDTIAELLALMYESNIRHVPVVDGDGDLVGLVTHRDVLRHTLMAQVDLPLTVQEELLESKQVGDLMTEEVISVEPGEPLDEVAQAMLENKIGCVPVVEGMRLVGILTESDFVRHLAATPQAAATP